MSLAGIENYHRPKQSVEALALLTTCGDGALIVNGGTFIHGLVARGLITGVKHIIDINDLKLDYINYDVDKLTIGSTTRFEQLENDLHIQNEAALGAIKDALTQERVSHAAARAKEDVVPLSDHRASAEYRVAMTEVLVRRCLQRSLERLDIT